MQPRITLITTVRNGEPFLPHLIDSVRAQRLQDFEWVVIDDGSSDRSLILLKEASEIDHRMRVILNPQPGRGRALRLAVESSRSPYIAVCDADDLSYPWRLEWQWEDMERYGDAAAIGYSSKLGRSVDFNQELSPAEIITAEVLAEQSECSAMRRMIVSNTHLKRGMPFTHSSSVLRREAVLDVGNYDVERVGQYDHSLLTRMAAAGMKVYLCQCTVGVRRLSSHQHFEVGSRRYRLASLHSHITAFQTIPGPSLPHLPHLVRTAAPLLLPNRFTVMVRRLFLGG